MHMACFSAYVTELPMSHNITSGIVRVAIHELQTDRTSTNSDGHGRRHARTDARTWVRGSHQDTQAGQWENWHCQMRGHTVLFLYDCTGNKLWLHEWSKRRDLTGVATAFFFLHQSWQNAAAKGTSCHRGDPHRYITYNQNFWQTLATWFNEHIGIVKWLRLMVVRTRVLPLIIKCCLARQAMKGENTPQREKQLYKVATPCLDDHHF